MSEIVPEVEAEVVQPEQQLDAPIVDAPVERAHGDYELPRVIADDLPRVIAHLQQLKADYAVRIAEIELFLGFAVSSEDLSVRMARIEKFIGIGG